ncbi:hypothetical protein A2U01_0062857, partial [Trifolium medium]|nr:hypothetical protein [Trifolium medium]
YKSPFRTTARQRTTFDYIDSDQVRSVAPSVEI